SGGDLDPHVWLDPELARGIVRNIRNALAAAWPEYEESFAQKFMELDGELTRLRIEMEQTLGPVRGREMVVFHPAYGYFARAFELKQAVIEAGGVTPGSKQLAEIIDHAHERRVTAIFVQPQFSTTTAEAVAASIGARLVTLDPLAYDYPENMRKMAETIRDALLPR
ncbi:MAG: zinc ABC transporter substrate-binding protein, partial [Candidatus Latescibacterota bacterium]